MYAQNSFLIQVLCACVHSPFTNNEIFIESLQAGKIINACHFFRHFVYINRGGGCYSILQADIFQRFYLLLCMKMAKLSYASYILLLLLVIAPGSKGQDQNNGTDMTALQKHVSFFDRDKDGVVYPTETFQGFRAIGCGIALSTVSAPIIHAFLSPKTNNGSIPAIKLPIIVANIAKGKHGSDSGAYDTNGNFVPEKFEEIFTKHAHAHPDSLTSDELKEMLKANQQSNDLSGSFASRTEWEILFSIAKNKDGLLQKDTVRSVYDGSLFYKLEAENKSPK